VDDDDYPSQSSRAPSPVLSVVLPVALLLIVVAVVAGLVFGGVVQGHEERVGPAEPPTTQSTIVIEP
jgi:FlaG/FlaF family flagellin (archaellin)